MCEQSRVPEQQQTREGRGEGGTQSLHTLRIDHKRTSFAVIGEQFSVKLQVT